MYLFQLLVPRQSYLPLVTDKVQRHFLKYVDPESHGEMWLEYNGQPLKWYVALLTHIWPNEKNTTTLNHFASYNGLPASRSLCIEMCTGIKTLMFLLLFKEDSSSNKNVLCGRHFPTGVLFDVTGADATLPWTVTVHFSVSDVIHCLIMISVNNDQPQR